MTQIIIGGGGSRKSTGQLERENERMTCGCTQERTRILRSDRMLKRKTERERERKVQFGATKTSEEGN